MATRSLWNAERPARDPSTPLRRSVRTDVCVIGAGVTGLSTAFDLVRRGHEVVVLDDGPVAGSETERTTAHLASALDDGFTGLEKEYGTDHARLAHESHATAIDRIEERVRSLRIDCDFRRVSGYLFANREQQVPELDAEYGAARRAGLTVLRQEAAPLPTAPGPCLRYARQAQFRPMPYLFALAREIVGAGNRIHRPVHAKDVGLDADGCRVRTDVGETIRAQHVVVATNAVALPFQLLTLKSYAYRTYALAAPVQRDEVPPGLYWDMDDPYHYVRLREAAPDRAGPDHLIVGGEDHRVGQANDGAQRWQRLGAWSRRLVPGLARPTHRWSGQVLETLDGLALIGPAPHQDRIFVATGDSGHGMTHGTIAGLLLADLIEGRKNPWASTYDPTRSPWPAWKHFFKENLAATKAYSSWARPRLRSRPLRRGEARVRWTREGPVAELRTGDGTLQRLSAVCGHLGCVVGWNPAESTWDCPCHGSRYDPLGRVLNGPSNTDLRPVLASRPKTTPRTRPRRVARPKASRRKGTATRRIGARI